METLHTVANPTHAVILFLHIILLVTWLGVDLGVFISSFFLRNPKYPINERLMIGRIAGILDMGPRASLLLVYPTGAWLAWIGEWGFTKPLGPLSPVTQLVLISFIFLIWEIMVWIQFWGHRKVLNGRASQKLEDFLTRYRRYDIYARWVLAAALIVDGILGILGQGFIDQPWLGWKVFLFGLIVVQGIAIRWAADAWPSLIRDIVDNGSTPAREAALNQAMRRAYPFVLIIYGLILTISMIGILK